MATHPTRTLVVAASCDEGVPSREHVRVVDGDVPDALPPGGALRLRALFLSADPYMRSQLRSTSARAITPGEPLRGFLVARVEASTLDAWAVGDVLGASLPLATLQVVTGGALARTAAWKLTGLVEDARLSLGVGAMGMPGATAYGGLFDVLRPQAGETLLVTAASGAVGQLVGQLARARGVRVIGTAGGPTKCALLRERFGFHEAIDYKAAAAVGPGELEARIRAAAGPKGLDMVFESVGTATFEAAFRCLGNGGRLAVCGGIAAYNDATEPLVSISPNQMIYTNQRVEGFVCGPWLTLQRGNFLETMKAALADGSVVVEETFYEGIDAWIDAFRALFDGSHMGKVVVRV